MDFCKWQLGMQIVLLDNLKWGKYWGWKHFLAAVPVHSFAQCYLSAAGVRIFVQCIIAFCPLGPSENAAA